MKLQRILVISFDESVFDGTGGITVIKAGVVAKISIESYISCRSRKLHK